MKIPIEISTWSRAYPEDVFPPPTKEQYAELHKALKEVGLTLDLFSADIMRHCMTRVVEILEAQQSLDDPQAGR